MGPHFYGHTAHVTTIVIIKGSFGRIYWKWGHELRVNERPRDLYFGGLDLM